MFYKKAKTDILGLVVAIAIVLVAASYLSGGQINFFSKQTPPQQSTSVSNIQGQTSDTANIVKVVGAPCTQGTTLTSSVLRRYTDVAQGAENATIYYLAANSPAGTSPALKGTIAHGSTTTVQSGPNADLLDVYEAAQSTSFFTQHIAGKLSTCTAGASTGDASFQLVQDHVNAPEFANIGFDPSLYLAGTGHKVMQIDTAPTITIVNDGQASQNTGRDGNNLTIGTGGTASVSVSIYPTYNQGWGSIGGNVVTCQFPQAVYDSLKPLRVTWGGKELQETNVKPDSIIYPLIGSNNTVRAFAAPPIDGRIQTLIPVNIQMRADQNHNPSGALDRMNCSIMATSYYQRQSDGKFVLDIENRDTSILPNGLSTTNYDFEIGVA